jgi:CheY-like chemotaxis protein
VEHAADGPAGWIALNHGTCDLVLLDWWLHGEDGISLLGRFRQKNRTTLVLFLTARDGVTERVTGLDAGADDYLCKPFAFEDEREAQPADGTQPLSMILTTLDEAGWSTVVEASYECNTWEVEAYQGAENHQLHIDAVSGEIVRDRLDD